MKHVNHAEFLAIANRYEFKREIYVVTAYKNVSYTLEILKETSVSCFAMLWWLRHYKILENGLGSR
jgi:hypothetical protein